MDVLARNNVRLLGVPGGPPMVLAHGFGCDQEMWRHVWPAFEADHRVVLLDHVGAGRSDLRAWDPERYTDLQAYADDLVEVCRALDLSDAVLVGHSVGATIALLAAVSAPELVSRLVLVAPSPRYVDDEGYTGGTSPEAVEGLLEALDANYLGWAQTMAPLIAGAEHPRAGAELTESFCRTDPRIARQFARTTFLADNRADLARVRTPALVLQVAEDPLAPVAVGEYLRDHLAAGELVVLDTSGHCPNLSAPGETVRAIRAWL